MIGKPSRIGLWMDHQEAKIVYPNGIVEPVKSTHVTNLRIPGEKPDGVRMGNYRSSNNEYSKNHSEIQELHKYFSEIFKLIKTYDEVLLFGPGTAPEEFRNYLIEKENGKIKKIIVRRTERMSEEELMEAVFSKENLNHSKQV